MKYPSKTALVKDCQEQWTQLWQLLETINVEQWEQPVGSGASTRTIVDHLGHLYAWHRLLLGWSKSRQPDLPAQGYKWSQTRSLNQKLYDELRNVSRQSMQRRLKLSHARVMKWVAACSEKQLLEPGQFEWTGKLPLASYIAPNVASHYRWAIKKIKKQVKLLAN